MNERSTLFGYPMTFTVDVNGTVVDLTPHLKENGAGGPLTLDLKGVLGSIHEARIRPQPNPATRATIQKIADTISGHIVGQVGRGGQ